MGLIPGLRSHGEGNGNPLQHSCLENPKDRGAWWATVHGVEESDKSNLYPQFKSFYHTFPDFDIFIPKTSFIQSNRPLRNILNH